MTSDWLAVLCVCRHAHRGKLAGHLVRGGVQVLQLPQVQTAAADQPRSQVAPVCEKIPRDISFGLLLSYVLSHECHRQEILFFSRQPCTSFLLRASGFPSATGHTLNLVIVASRLDSEGIELLLSFLKVSLAKLVLPASPTFTMLHGFLQVAFTVSLVDIVLYMPS